jgi:hypothetical protein
MSDEARKALARLGMELRAYANIGDIALKVTAWRSVLIDLSEVERGMAELEDYKKLAEKRLDLWSEDYHRLKDELKNLRDYMRKFEPFKTWAEEDAVTISYPPAQELLDKLILTLIDNGPLAYRAIRPEENRVREIMARVIGPALAHPMIVKPLGGIYMGVDKAHDEGDEASARFYRRNDDGSITILAELRGEAAEYVAELEDNFNDLSHRFSCALEHATGGKMSKTNYTKEAMYREIDGHTQDLCDEAVKELKDSLPKRTLRWDGERRDGEGAYICIYCDEELPPLGAIIHKADCIQATMFR